MRIRQEDLELLRGQGIWVGIYPTENMEKEKYEETLKEYEEKFSHPVERSWFNSKTNSWEYEYGKPRENWKQEAKDWADRDFSYNCGWSGRVYDSTKYYISYQNGEKIFSRTCQKSKSVTIDEIVKAIGRNEKAYQGKFGDFSLKMQKIIKSLGYENVLSVYPTLYGIGVWNIFNYDVRNDVKNVSDILNKFGIEYENEFSDAKWVYRFKISKDKENMARLKKVC